jgi:hypothetical protein
MHSAVVPKYPVRGVEWTIGSSAREPRVPTISIKRERLRTLEAVLTLRQIP